MRLILDFSVAGSNLLRPAHHACRSNPPLILLERARAAHTENYKDGVVRDEFAML